jgi:hypothetical protein
MNLLWVILHHCQYPDHKASSRRMIGERLIGRNLEGSVCDLIEVLLQSLRGRTEENQEKSLVKIPSVI